MVGCLKLKQIALKSESCWQRGESPPLQRYVTTNLVGTVNRDLLEKICFFPTFSIYFQFFLKQNFISMLISNTVGRKRM